MSKLIVIVGAMAFALCANAAERSSSETEVSRLVAACNGAANSSKGRAMRACERLEKEGRLALVEPAAVAAYQRYQDERLQACLRRQASPRGQSRPQSNCGS